MKKKFISVVLCAAMAAGVLAGCGAKSSESKSEKTSDGKTKVRMTYWNSEDTVKTLLEYLEKEVPDVTVEFQFIDNSNYDTVVDTQLSAEEGPDIITLWSVTLVDVAINTPGSSGFNEFDFQTFKLQSSAVKALCRGRDVPAWYGKAKRGVKSPAGHDESSFSL